MEEFRIGRFFRREIEIQPGVRRVLWRQLRSEVFGEDTLIMLARRE